MNNMYMIQSVGFHNYALDIIRGYRIWVLLFFLLPTLAFAQEPKAVFEQTVDDFNRITIRQVLAADKESPGASELAQQIAEPSYDLATLSADLQTVYGKNSKTEILSRTISKQKGNFIVGKPLAAQFASIIQLIRDDRKGKPYLAELEKELVNAREAALKVAAAPAPASGTTPPNNQVASLQAQVDDLQKQLSNSSNSTTMPSSGVPTYVIILLVLIGGLSAYNYWLFWKWKNRKRSSQPENTFTQPAANAGLSAEEVNRKIKESTANLEKRLDLMREQWKAEMNELRKEVKRSNEKPPQPTKEKYAPHQKNNANNAQPSHRGNVTGRTDVPASTPTSTPTDGSKRADGGTSTPGIATPGQTFDLNVRRVSSTPEPEKGGYSVKKYADYPKENGFVIAQLEDSTDRRSIYELSIAPDQSRATFTVVNDPAIHEYAIQNRERLLRDACDFEISSSKHTRIEVIEPGTLHMDGNAWQIRSKAKIRFV